ncbi:MAG: carnitine 3-dehydrogenase [Mesorhizobium sp.]|nr:MAG: carnitine 3-dehydrogenase [Mesorhizobium sp.]
MVDISKAAIIGGGVIGGGWVARFLLTGIDVAVHDPNPDAARIVGEVIDNARRAYRKMLSVPLCAEGTLTIAETVADAVRDAEYIQESVPERLEIKQSVFTEIEMHARVDAIIGSSTSNFTPSQLQQGRNHPERLLVVHPFNPVYLLPLVEIVATGANSEEIVRRTMDISEAIGMKPLRLRKEICAHIGNRLLEAAWRESLWMIKDDIVTTEELDDVIRYGLGLRFAQMGQFESYRIAGGEGGMRHFIGQFGPTLSWPLTKLTNVPELDDALVDKIASQSDEQSGAHSIRELERIRDDNLVAIMLGLRAHHWGAGTLVTEMENRMRAQSAQVVVDGTVFYETQVPAHWADYNGHMTEHRYTEAFGHATDRLLSQIGLDGAYLEAGHSIFTAESHVTFRQEVKVGARISVRTQLVGRDKLNIHLAHEMFVDGVERSVALSEVRLVHVDINAGGVCAFAPEMKEKLDAIWNVHKGLERPRFVNRSIRVIG